MVIAVRSSVHSSVGVVCTGESEKFVYEKGATLAISSIYFPTTANIAQIEVIVIPPQIF